VGRQCDRKRRQESGPPSLIQGLFVATLLAWQRDYQVTWSCTTPTTTTEKMGQV
jgi:hypothetical protein